MLAHSRMYHVLTMPFRTNGSPLAYSSAASRVVRTAIVRSFSSWLLRKAPDIRSLPYGIFEGVIEGLEECDVIQLCLCWHVSLLSSSGKLYPHDLTTWDLKIKKALRVIELVVARCQNLLLECCWLICLQLQPCSTTRLLLI